VKRNQPPEPATAPKGFDEFWAEVDRDLTLHAAMPAVEELPIHSSGHSTVYGVRLTSLGGYRVFAYYSVPAGAGPFPALFCTPSYGSVAALADLSVRRTYAVLSLAHRGQRNSDQDWAAEYPGLLTYGIESAQTFAFRGIVADCIRATEFLVGRPEVDTTRAAIAGNDLAILTASRRPVFRAVQSMDLILYRAMEARLSREDYPLEELNDYVRTYPDRRERVSRSLSMFDPVHHASRIAVPTQVTFSGEADRKWLRPLFDRLGLGEWYRRTFHSAADLAACDDWLARQLDVIAVRPFQRPMW
jgi:cephalosporin-C deacetylase